MRTIKASEFANDYQYKAAKKQAKKCEIGRRSGRRGSSAWGVWADKE